MPNAAAPAKAPTKTEIIAHISEQAEITKKQAGIALDALQAMAADSLKKNGVFMIPGFVKVSVSIKPATEARMGINPFTKEEVEFKAKPARKVLKVVPMKALKDSV